MSTVQASCPSCGAPVAFQRGGAVVVVCEYCRSVVARTDRGLEAYGKVAELLETGSPLQPGLRGAYQGKAFELVGRAQMGHQAGGVWDEWYAYFSDGRWGWLAEAQGNFYPTWRRTLRPDTIVPPFDALQPGQQITTITSAFPLTVAETGYARALSAQGEIPYAFTPGEETPYADLSGPRNEFATLDYSETPPLLFTGNQVTLTDLGLDRVVAPKRAQQAGKGGATSAQLNCPKCGGALALRAPDQTQRVTCPSCASLLDVEQGHLKFLRTLNPQRFKPILPIGAVGEFPIGKMTCVGAMLRSVTFEGVKYYWEEYLLYEPKLGFRWLTQSDNHWNFVQTLGPGAVTANGNTAELAGDSFRIYQDARAVVEHVFGEFYWKVNVDEVVQASDFIRPPLMLSCEKAHYGKAGAAEINWSLGTYLKKEDVEKAFGLKEPLATPEGVAPNQPFGLKDIYRLWGYLALGLIGLGMLVMLFTREHAVFKNNFTLEPRAKADDTQTIFTEPFELQARKNIRIKASADVSNTWLYVEGDLINEETGLVQPFSFPLEYYSGVEDGESWAEGSREADMYLSSLPAGKYTLRLEAQWESWNQQKELRLELTQGHARPLYWLLALVALSLLPIGVAIYHYTFEVKRWENSEFSPYQSSSDE